MVYLLGLILVPLSFLYSPRIEKSHVVYFTKTMTISQERNSPAYLAFKETQKLTQVTKSNTEVENSLGTTTREVVALSTENINPLNPETGRIEPKNLQPMAFTRDELHKDTDEKIQQMVLAQKNSALLNAFNSSAFNAQPIVPTFDNQKNTTNKNGIVIRGSFELREGVGIVDHIVSLTRITDGQTLELGQVDLRAGLYQIVVNSFEGELLAEIKDKNGYLIGEDRQEIAGLKQSGTIFQGPSLKLGKPSSYSFNARYADDTRKMQEGSNDLMASFFSGNYDLQRTNEDYPNVDRQSSTVGFIHDPKQKLINTLTLRTAQDNTETILFSKLWVDGAISYAAQKLQIQFSAESGVILGRVVDNGVPVENVRVTIDDQPGIEVFYLDDFWIPQNEKQSTSKNGYFFIPGLSRGSYQISAFDISYNKNKGSQLYVVDENALSYQELNYQKNATQFALFSYDAFTSQPMPTELILPGMEDIVSIDESGEMKMRVNYKNGIQELVNRPPNRDYLAYTSVRAGSESFSYFPQISENWLKLISEKAKISVDLDKSVFIAFTATPEFTIMLADESYDTRNAIYFDSKGELAQTPTIGGGAIFFNIGEGLHEAVVNESITQKVHSRAFYAKPNRIYLSVFN